MENQSSGVLRRTSFDQYGMMDTPSEHSESNDSLNIQDSDYCNVEQNRFRSHKISDNGHHLNTPKGKEATGIVHSLVRRSTAQRIRNRAERRPIQEPIPQLSDDIYSCQLCRKTFRSQPDLSSHGFRYLQQGILVCMLCSNKQVDDLDRHIKLEHQSDKKKVTCTLCQTLVDRNYYVSHVKEHHCIVKNFQCDLCNMKFSFLQNLLYHKSTDHLKEVQHSKYCQRNGDMMSFMPSSGVCREEKSTFDCKYGSKSSMHAKCLSHSEFLIVNSVTASKTEHKKFLNSLRTSTSTVTCVDNLGCLREGSADEEFGSRRSSYSTEGSSFSSSDYSSCCSSSGSECSHSTSRGGTSSLNVQPLKDKSKDYICQLCGATWTTRFLYLRHLKEDHHWTKDKLLDPTYDPDIWCPECGKLERVCTQINGNVF